MGILKLPKKTMWIAGSILLVLLLLVGSGGLIAKHYLNKINRVDESTLSTVAPKDEDFEVDPPTAPEASSQIVLDPEAVEWEEIDKIPNHKDMLTEAEDAVYLRNLLKELSQDTREVIILRIYEEMKFKDIAKIMGCSVSTTKSRFRLGVNQLKKLMETSYEKSTIN